MNKKKIYQYVNNEVSDESELECIISWIEESEENRQLYSDVKNLCSYVAFSDDQHLNYNIKKTTVRKLLSVKMLKYAALVIISFSLGIGAILFKGKQKLQPTYSEVIVPFGQSAKVKLPDSSSVYLRSGSHLIYPSSFSEVSRDVSLSGEATFEVTHNAKRPFHVNVRDIKVEVLGTTFNVESEEKSQFVDVTLVEGKVAIENTKGQVLTNLSPNHNVHYNIKDKTLNVSKVDTAFYSKWKKGIYTITNATLKEISFKLERLYNVKIIFDDDDIKYARFSGAILSNKPLNRILEALKYSSSIDYYYKQNKNNANEIHLKKM